MHLQRLRCATQPASRTKSAGPKASACAQKATLAPCVHSQVCHWGNGPEGTKHAHIDVSSDVIYQMAVVCGCFLLHFTIELPCTTYLALALAVCTDICLGTQFCLGPNTCACVNSLDGEQCDTLRMLPTCPCDTLVHLASSNSATSLLCSESAAVGFAPRPTELRDGGERDGEECPRAPGKVGPGHSDTLGRFGRGTLRHYLGRQLINIARPGRHRFEHFGGNPRSLGWRNVKVLPGGLVGGIR